MGEERKTLKSSLLPLRALLGSGSTSPVLQAVELYVSTACCCAEASWDNFPQLCQSWLFPHGWSSGAAARLGFEKPEPTSSFFKSLSSFVALLSPSLDFLPLFTLSRWGNSPPQAYLRCWSSPLQHSQDTCKSLLK